MLSAYVAVAYVSLYLLDDKASETVANQDERSVAFLLYVLETKS
jgi:hypothetical protein